MGLNMELLRASRDWVQRWLRWAGTMNLAGRPEAHGHGVKEGGVRGGDLDGSGMRSKVRRAVRRLPTL